LLKNIAAIEEQSQTGYKRQLAYAHLGINAKDVKCMPFLHADLRRIARVIRGVTHNDPSSLLVRPLDCLEFSDDPDARKVLSVYRSVPTSYRKLLPIEAYCLAAKVSPGQVLEFLTVIAVREGARASAILASILHPSVVKKTVERALQEDGAKERMMLHKAVGFLAVRG